MEKYNVTGMTCSACSAHIEKAVKKVPGVENVSVSLLTNSMGIEGNASSAEIIKAVEQAGYGASSASEERMEGKAGQKKSSDLEDKETPHLMKRFIVSLCFLLPLMYISMGHMMWGWPLPKFLVGNHVAMGLTQMLFTIIIMVINQKFFISGFTSLVHKSPNMDTLVAMGATAAFVYSTYALYAMTGAVVDGNAQMVNHYMMEFYFESAAMILTLITMGKTLEAYSKGKTTDALKNLMDLTPKTATLLLDGKEMEVPVEQLKKGDWFVVRAGESIPVDAVIAEGSCAIDESALTGESIPVDKMEGDSVSAATINQSGFITCRATRVGEDTTISQIIQMVSDAAATKAPIAKIADEVSGIFVPAVIVIAVATMIIWMLVGQTVGFALARAIAVLVISCPCALGLATPVAIMVGNGKGARSGILFKTASSLEAAGRTEIIAMDKTGTLTYGKPEVTDIIRVELEPQNRLLEERLGPTSERLETIAYALEAKSEHPLAHAIMEYGKERQVRQLVSTEFEVAPGNGLTAVIDHKLAVGGNAEFIKQYIILPPQLEQQANELSEAGKTPLYFAYNGQPLGIIAVADVIKENAAEVVAELRHMGMEVVMITGDNERTAAAIGAQIGVDDIIAGVLPSGKEEQIRKLSELGKVAMVGDGINDAPALTRAHVGIAIGAGTDVAIDAADVILVKSRLEDIPGAIRLSRNVIRNIHENLFWAFFYNVIGIPLAAGAYIYAFGWTLNPMFGALAMSLSSFCVVTNALRLNLVKVYDSARDKDIRHISWYSKLYRKLKQDVESWKEARAIKAEEARVQQDVTEGTQTYITENQEEEKETMTKTMKIKGMMCGHCEASVKGALEALEGVTAAEVSHEAGTAIVTMSAEVSDEVLTKAVTEKDYEVVSVEA